MQLEIITPDQSLFAGEAKMVSVPGISGSLGVLNNHAPMITALKKGTVKVTRNDDSQELFEVNGGVLEVLNNKVILLAE